MNSESIQEITSPEKVATWVKILRMFVGVFASFICIVIIASAITAIKTFTSFYIPDSAWIASLIIVLGDGIIRAINDLRDKK